MQIAFRDDLKKLKPITEPFHAYEVRLNTNESPFDFPPELKELALKRLAETDFNRYSGEYIERFRQALASYHNVDPDRIAIANGMDEMIRLCVRAFGIGAKAVAHVPTFESYEMSAIAEGVPFVGVPLLEGFKLDVPRLIEEATTFEGSHAEDQGIPGILFLCNPNNPTGNAFPMEEIESIVKASKMVVAIDEAYWDFGNPDALYMLDKYDHVIIMRTFSKAFGLAGIRLGYAITTPEIVSELSKVRQIFNVNSLSVTVAQVALENDDYKKEFVEFVIEERERMFEALSKIKGVQPFPSDTNFMLFRTEKPAEEVLAKLAEPLTDDKDQSSPKKRGIGVRNYSDRPSLENCLRVTIGRKEENDLFVERLREIMEG
ncbi:MAG TPA: histidinol-phosphate transaminase [Bacillota bacterium]|nr:histidinol-phosphate transaminase [Bacillota bacterium]HPV13623.1 histidinol-phosphate transaminase [Bacillota bacterium]HPZ78424.1 histidinol-phosphate transaminase [Bacillota bacterium]HQD74468.1 histidinol-phosphate transaminase [Bacillota bacterium]